MQVRAVVVVTGTVTVVVGLRTCTHEYVYIPHQSTKLTGPTPRNLVLTATASQEPQSTVLVAVAVLAYTVSVNRFKKCGATVLVLVHDTCGILWARLLCIRRMRLVEGEAETHQTPTRVIVAARVAVNFMMEEWLRATCEFWLLAKMTIYQSF